MTAASLGLTNVLLPHCLRAVDSSCCFHRYCCCYVAIAENLTGAVGAAADEPQTVVVAYCRYLDASDAAGEEWIRHLVAGVDRAGVPADHQLLQPHPELDC